MRKLVLALPVAALLGVSSALILLSAAPVYAQSTKSEPIHIVVDSDAKAREIFTYFPYPRLPDGYQLITDRGDSLSIRPHPRYLIIQGVYRLEVDAKGSIAAISILKSMGRPLDVLAMKTFVHWQAHPGVARNIDVPWRVSAMIHRNLMP
jgi:hypothetical protein